MICCDFSSIDDSDEDGWLCAVAVDTSDRVATSRARIIRGLFMLMFTLDIVKGFSMRTETLLVYNLYLLLIKSGPGSTIRLYHDFAVFNVDQEARGCLPHCGDR